MKKLKEGVQVDADIAANKKQTFWIQAIIIRIDEKFITVREIGTDDEWTLNHDKVRLYNFKSAI